MIPATVRSLADIDELGGDEQLIHAVSLLDFLIAVSPAYGRDESETLGAVINRRRDKFSQISDLNFALRVRNKIIHPRPGNANDPDLVPAAVDRAVAYVLDAIQRDVAPLVPDEIGSVLLGDEYGVASEAGTVDTEPGIRYAAGWRYEQITNSTTRPWEGSGLPPDAAVVTSPVPKATDWRDAARTICSSRPALLWGVISCVPPMLIVVWLLISTLGSFVPVNLLVYGVLGWLVISSIRWLRSG